jgi:hypothetical protein
MGQETSGLSAICEKTARKATAKEDLNETRCRNAAYLLFFWIDFVEAAIFYVSGDRRFAQYTGCTSAAPQIALRVAERALIHNEIRPGTESD